jgi:hypothetical protein
MEDACPDDFSELFFSVGTVDVFFVFLELGLGLGLGIFRGFDFPIPFSIKI